MKRMSDKEVAEKVLNEFNDFVKGVHNEYGVGAGMFIISLEEDNMDTLVGSVFGNVRKWSEHWEDRLKDCAIETIEGATRSAKERCEDCDRKVKDIDEIANNLKKIVDRNKC